MPSNLVEEVARRSQGVPWSSVSPTTLFARRHIRPPQMPHIYKSQRGAGILSPNLAKNGEALTQENAAELDA